MAEYPGYDTHCRHCGKPIIFIRTLNGKLMPCDATPVKYWLTEEPGRGVMIYQRNGTYARALLDGLPSTCDGTGYLPHWSSCRPRKKAAAKPEPRRDSPARQAIHERVEKERAAREERERRAAEKRAAEERLREAEAAQSSLFDRC